ncbi:hypothetical protein PVT67_17440 [Gallaecimonas kandeliae]|uniref:hypothetical protein n=1 Tax=Gallaecimonas kandeliae TaxID=3029055 RepID=UPI0026497904|nr:hypothetical protein [Gallaecimonas kandeliae]WKE65427.1 hypothetical protein PVT67_17440 [Gallaecimonas kandeliae]
MSEQEFLAYLKNELHQYSLIPAQDGPRKREKKQYIKGLMTASRFFGVSFEALEEVVGTTLKPLDGGMDSTAREELLDIPTVIRKKIPISID